MGVEKEIEETYNKDNFGYSFDEVKEGLSDGWRSGYLFKCLYCGKHLLCVDCD